MSSRRKQQQKITARHDQESDRRHRVALVQHRDLADDDFRERVHRMRHGDARLGHAHVCSCSSIRLRRISPRSFGRRSAEVPGGGDITAQSWPSYDESFLVEDEVEIVLQVNGKAARQNHRARSRPPNAELEAAARANPESAECDRRQDDSQGRRRPQKACQRRRRLTSIVGHVERVQGIRGQGERHRPGGRRHHWRGLRRRSSPRW